MRDLQQNKERHKTAQQKVEEMYKKKPSIQEIKQKEREEKQAAEEMMKFEKAKEENENIKIQ